MDSRLRGNDGWVAGRSDPVNPEQSHIPFRFVKADPMSHNVLGIRQPDAGGSHASIDDRHQPPSPADEPDGGQAPAHRNGLRSGLSGPGPALGEDPGSDVLGRLFGRRGVRSQRVQPRHDWDLPPESEQPQLYRSPVGVADNQRSDRQGPFDHQSDHCCRRPGVQPASQGMFLLLGARLGSRRGRGRGLCRASQPPGGWRAFLL